jgi:hypothetical protein
MLMTMVVLLLHILALPLLVAFVLLLVDVWRRRWRRHSCVVALRIGDIVACGHTLPTNYLRMSSSTSQVESHHSHVRHLQKKWSSPVAYEYLGTSKYFVIFESLTGDTHKWNSWLIWFTSSICLYNMNVYMCNSNDVHNGCVVCWHNTTQHNTPHQKKKKCKIVTRYFQPQSAQPGIFFFEFFLIVECYHHVQQSRYHLNKLIFNHQFNIDML